MKDWVEFQRHLYYRIRHEVDQTLGTRSKELLRYEKEFNADQEGWRDSSLAILVRQLNRSNLVFIGDFHPLRQSQRLVLRLLRQREIQKPSAIAFEVLGDRQKLLLSHWLKNPKSETAERELQRSLQLETKWRASWTTYRELFLTCDEQNIEVIPLYSSHEKIKNRDKAAADRIHSIQQTPLWVLMGEFHCSRNHLPALISQQQYPKICVLQQNDDRATLNRLSRLKGSQTLVLEAPLRAHISLFCILHSPLWLKWQTFLESNLKEPHVKDAFDLHEQILWSLETLLHFLEDARYVFRVTREDLLDFEVFGPEDAGFYSHLSKLPASQRKEMFRSLEVRQFAITTEKNRIFVSDPTTNSCAQAAGAYLFRRLSQSPSDRQDFFRLAVDEALSYFLSKILNHSRRARHLADWEVILKRSKATKRTEAKAVIHIDQLLREIKLTPSSIKRLKMHKTEVPVALARMAADSLFEAFLVSEFSKQRLLRLLTEPLTTEAKAYEKFIEIRSVSSPFSTHEPRSI